MDIYYIDRKTGEKKKEVVAGDRFLNWIYETKSGNSILELLVKKKLFSKLYGAVQEFSFSTRKMGSFIQSLEIDMKEAEMENIKDYRCFNDFFARRLKSNARPIHREKNHLASPADGRILAYEHIEMDQVVQVKGSSYRLEELFQDKSLAREYDGGVCMVIRLCPSDYHRFHFPDAGIPGNWRRIEGDYYSVNPIALKKVIGIYCQNKREITLFESENFGQIVMVEVGATCVGSMVQTYAPGERVEKGQEKGYFKFGGSTVILFFKPGVLQVDQDLLQNTQDGIETKINMGESIGIKKGIEK